MNDRWEPLGIAGAWLHRPRIHHDRRGSFLEWFNAGEVERVRGTPFPVAQVNCPVSRRGAVRGIHFTDTPPGQAKYVSCVHGRVLDVVVDVRLGSPTFGRHITVRLDDAERHAVYLAEGLGHGLIALSGLATVLYLCSTPYAPEHERRIDPLDPDLGIAWPSEPAPILSPQDAAAPRLAAARTAGWLPRYAGDRTGAR